MAQSVMSMATKKAAAAQARPSLRRSTARLSVRVQASSGASNRNNNNNEGVTSQGKRDFIKKLALGATTTFGALQGMQKDAMAADNETVASSRMSYSRFLEYLDLDRVKKVDLYDNGTTAIVEAVSPEVGNRIQRVRVQLPAHVGRQAALIVQHIRCSRPHAQLNLARRRSIVAHTHGVPHLQPRHGCRADDERMRRGQPRPWRARSLACSAGDGSMLTRDAFVGGRSGRQCGKVALSRVKR